MSVKSGHGQRSSGIHGCQVSPSGMGARSPYLGTCSGNACDLSISCVHHRPNPTDRCRPQEMTEGDVSPDDEKSVKIVFQRQTARPCLCRMDINSNYISHFGVFGYHLSPVQVSSADYRFSCPPVSTSPGSPAATSPWDRSARRIAPSSTPWGSRTRRSISRWSASPPLGTRRRRATRRSAVRPRW